MYPYFIVQLLKLFMSDSDLFLCKVVTLLALSCGLTAVNPEIFARILFSRIALKDIFATLKIRDKGMIYLYQ